MPVPFGPAVLWGPGRVVVDLTITQAVERGEPWTPAELCETLGKLELHALADAYS